MRSEEAKASAGGRRRPTHKQCRFAREYVINGGNGVQAAKAAYNPSHDRSAHCIAWENLQKPAVREQIRKELALAGPEIGDVFAALRRIFETAGPRELLAGFDAWLELARFADEPSQGDEAWDFRAEARRRLLEERPTVANWMGAMEALLEAPHGHRVRMAAASRLIDLLIEGQNPGPGPGEKEEPIDPELMMKLHNLPLPVLQHMIDTGTEEIPSEEEQRRIVEEHRAANGLEWSPCPEGVNQ